MAHWPGRISLDDLNWKTRRYRPWLAYSQSKLANLLFTSELQRRLDAAGSPLRAVAAHPGYSHTNLQGATGRQLSDTLMSAATRVFATDADFGARQTLYAASQDLPGRHVHRAPIRQPGPHPARRPQPGGTRRGNRHRALGAVRAAHGHQIPALRCS